jgi:hypothetical protein
MKPVHPIHLSEFQYYVLPMHAGAPVLLNLPNPVKYLSQEEGFVMSLEASIVHPYPATVEWFQNGEGPLQNDSRRTFGFPTLTISRVDVSDSGMYILRATNYIPGDPPELLGIGSGSFTLDVLCEWGRGEL